jgi:hypothetical protein
MRALWATVQEARRRPQTLAAVQRHDPDPRRGRRGTGVGSAPWHDYRQPTARLRFDGGCAAQPPAGHRLSPPPLSHSGPSSRLLRTVQCGKRGSWVREVALDRRFWKLCEEDWVRFRLARITAATCSRASGWNTARISRSPVWWPTGGAGRCRRQSRTAPAGHRTSSSRHRSATRSARTGRG